MLDEVTEFQIEVPETDLRDLRERLERTRWPEEETVEDWSQGVPRAYIQELCGYWANRYDWRATEARLNALPQFRTEIDGLGIHFLHVRSTPFTSSAPPFPDTASATSRHGRAGASSG
jgi:epoxide hydrolase